MQTQLSTSQEAALDSFLKFLDSDDPYMVISGFAGSGKTFLLSHLLDVLDNYQSLQLQLSGSFSAWQCYFTATTNKAAEVMRRTLHKKRHPRVTTIHSLLNLVVKNNYKTGTVTLEQRRAPMLPAGALIFCDESSMIDSSLMSYIKAAQENGPGKRKIVFIGDPYQLPPVMQKMTPIFRQKRNHVFLNEIQRQVAHSPIIQLSAKYRDVIDNPLVPWPEIKTDGNTIFHYEKSADFEQAICDAIPSGQGYNPNEVKVLAWSNRKVRHYNEVLRKHHGHSDQLEVGDILLCNKALHVNGALEMPTDSLVEILKVHDTDELGIKGYQLTVAPWYNGMRYGYGFTVFHPKCWVETNRLLKQFAANKNWHKYFLVKDNWADFRPMFALTCHKAQGSTYDKVFMDLRDIGSNTQWQEVARLAYVAVSRAKHQLHVLGSIQTQHRAKESGQDYATMEATLRNL